MTKLLDRAIQEIRKLPPERQDDAAAILLTLAEQGEAKFELTPEQRKNLDESIEQADAGRFVDEEEIEALYKKYGT